MRDHHGVFMGIYPRILKYEKLSSRSGAIAVVSRRSPHVQWCEGAAPKVQSVWRAQLPKVQRVWGAQPPGCWGSEGQQPPQGNPSFINREL